MAKNNSNSASAPEPVLVAGYREITFEDGKKAIALLMKNAVAKNPIFKAKATKTGSAYIAAGITMEEVKAAMPLGSVVVGATWGEKKETEFDGVYEVEGLQ